MSEFCCNESGEIRNRLRESERPEIIDPRMPTAAELLNKLGQRGVGKRRRGQRKHKHQQCKNRKPGPPSGNSRPLRNLRMPQAAKLQQNRPHKPSHPQIVGHGQKNQDGQPRHQLVRARRNRKNNVPAIELPAGQQVQRSRKHPDPRRNRHRVQPHAIQRQRRRARAADASMPRADAPTERLTDTPGHTPPGRSQDEPVSTIRATR